MTELRDEPPDGPASRALWDEYQALVAERLGPGFVPTPTIFGESSAFSGPRTAWLVAYADGRPVGCGGLRGLDERTGEIKRMFVTAEARGRGVGRLLLAQLEARARAAGLHRIRLLTTEALAEARALYESVGYREVEQWSVDGRREFWLERDLE